MVGVSLTCMAQLVELHRAVFEDINLCTLLLEFVQGPRPTVRLVNRTFARVLQSEVGRLREVLFVLERLVLDRVVLRNDFRDSWYECVGCAATPIRGYYLQDRGGAGCIHCGACYVPTCLDVDGQTEAARQIFGWYDRDDGSHYTTAAARWWQ